MSEQRSPDLPSFEPQGTEQISSIPERFLVGGVLGLRADGRWTFRGELIDHKGVCDFLARQLRRTEEGPYWVVNGPQRVLVEVEDAPYFVTLLHVDPGAETMVIRLNDRSEEPLLLETLFRGPDELLYAGVKEGEAGAAPGERHVARFLRTAVMPLEPYLIELDDGGVGLAFGGRRYAIPQHPPPSIPRAPAPAATP